MSNFGIICEFNPMHNGHKYIIDEARKRGAERVVCLMSGNATQRGELAVVDKYRRAEAALMSGADLVLELPFPWCTSSAEYFAGAGVYALKDICDTLFFGSENGDIDILDSAANVCESESFSLEYRERLEKGDGAAYAFASLLEEHGFKDAGSNDILGIAYLRAIKKLKSDMRALTVKRVGAVINQEGIIDGEFQSATALRKAIKCGKSFEKYMPEASAKMIDKAISDGDLTDHALIGRLILGYYRLSDPEALSKLCELDGGVANRICKTAMSAANYEEFLETLKTKRYTDAKLRRALLFGICCVRDSLVKSYPEYVTLLAANQKGRELLRKVNKQKDGVTVVTKPADAPRNEQFRAGEALDSLFSLARENTYPPEYFLRKNAIII